MAAQLVRAPVREVECPPADHREAGSSGAQRHPDRQRRGHSHATKRKPSVLADAGLFDFGG